MNKTVSAIVFNEDLVKEFEHIIVREINLYSDKRLKNNKYAFGTCLKEDVKQEALLALYNSVNKYTGDDYEGFIKYATVSIRNAIFKMYYGERKNKDVMLQSDVQDNLNDSDFDSVYKDVKVMYYDEVQRNYREVLDILNENKDYLNKRCNSGLKIFFLHYVYGYKFNEITKLLDMTPKQVYDRVERFQKIVKELMN